MWYLAKVQVQISRHECNCGLGTWTHIDLTLNSTLLGHLWVCLQGDLDASDHVLVVAKPWEVCCDKYNENSIWIKTHTFTCGGHEVTCLETVHTWLQIQIPLYSTFKFVFATCRLLMKSGYPLWQTSNAWLHLCSLGGRKDLIEYLSFYAIWTSFLGKYWSAFQLEILIWELCLLTS